MKKLIAMFICVGLAFTAFNDRLTITNDNGTVQYFNIDNDGAITTAGDQTIVGDVGVTGALTITGDTTLDGVSNKSFSGLIQLDTATALTVTDGYMLVIGSNATNGEFAMTSGATPFIATTTATNGDTVIIMRPPSSDGDVTLSDNSQVSGSLLELDGDTVVLSTNSNISLTYYSGKWIQSGGINTID